ncbi:MAG: ABC transporter ATP-binding protein/permease [Lachnospiraceae bacterium]|nr:ABC transporter ATP-binding protein/permease [Lachnospiraceae bacterium]
MKRLLVYLKGYKKECILAPLFKMLEASFELFVPLVVADLIDNGIARMDKGIIVRSFVLLVILGFIGLVASLTAQFFAAKAAVNFATDLRHSLFSHLMKLGFPEIDRLGTSTMITRMTSDVNQLQNGVNMVLRLFLRSPFVVFGAMIMAFTIDVKSALIFLAVIVTLSFVVFGLMIVDIRLASKVQQDLERVLSATRENLNGVRVIRAFCKEKEEYNRFSEDNGILTAALNHASNMTAMLNPLTYVMINGAIIALIYTGALHVSKGIISQGQVVALYNYMSQILVELIKLANLIVLIIKSVASGNRVSAVFDINPSMKDAQIDIADKETQGESENGKYSVEYRNVSLTYPTAGDASLENISFKVEKGRTVGIIGGTGCGKTSLVHLLCRFYEVSNGEVLINGTDVREYTTDSLRKKVGIVMQKAVLFKGTLRDNLRWADKNATDEEMNEALMNAQAYDMMQEKGGLDAVIEQGGRNFSGGQKQRLSIARTLIGKPEILILDDSSSALDYLTDLNLRKAISRLEYDPTVFIVSGRCASIMSADMIIVLDDGKVAGIGRHDELLETCDVYKEIYASQYKGVSV